MKFVAGILILAATLASLQAGPVRDHGALHVDGARIVGRDGRPVSLAGNSFFWSQWEGRFYNAEIVEWLKQDWQAGIVRVALGVERDGYLSNPSLEKARIVTVVDAAIAADLYVIIDWHDHHAHQHTALAAAFFEEMARKYRGQPHVIYEIFNEPLADASWSRDVKPYAEKIIAVIRAVEPDSLIIVGSPHWSQDVDVAAADPIKANNIAYSLHFYAGTHKNYLREKARKALEQGLPLFVTEWGTCNADGNGPVDARSTEEWMAFMQKWGLSHCNWAVSDKKESASIVVPGAASTGGWKKSELTASGRLVREWMRRWAAEPTVKAK